MHSDAVAVCIPSREHVHADFAIDLATSVGHLVARNIKTSVHSAKGTYIFDQREKLVVAGMEAGASCILFADSDMRFTPDAVISLISGLDEYSIVAANYPMRVDPYRPTAMILKGGDWEYPTSTGKTGREEIHAAGFGLVAIRSEVFASMKRPWFQGLVMSADGGIISEDVSMCLKAANAGHKIAIDHDASQGVAHIGVIEHRF